MGLRLPHLGGPASLGCLYDARTDQYLTGVKLWSKETMKEMTTSQKYTNQTMSIESESTFSNKANKLEISASLKLSFLSGMVTVEGAGRYLSDSKTSINSEMLTFTCSIMTELKELHVGTEIEYPKFLDDGSATHVVTGVQYGARAFLVFERELQDSENKSQVSGEFKGQVSKFKGQFEASGQIKADFDSQELDKTEKIKCRYYGDFKLEPPPLTLKEAIGCIKSFSSDNANSPITVYLTPLSQLAGKPQALIKIIYEEYLNDAGDYCQLLSDVINSAGAKIKLLEDTPWHVQRKLLQQFSSLVQTHKTRLTQKLVETLPKIRETGGSGEELAKILIEFRDKSPFTSQNIETWMKNKERECLALQRFADSLTAAGAKMLSEPSEKDKFGSEAGGRVLIEFLLPESEFVRTCSAFQRSESVSAGEAPEATWIETETYISTQSKLSGVLRFLSVNSTLKAAFNCAKAEQNLSIDLQVKYLTNHKWVPAKIPVPPTELKYVRSGPTYAFFVWVSSGTGIEFKVRASKAGEKQDWRFLSESTAANEVELLGLDPGTEYEAQVVGFSDLGESEPSSFIRFSTEPPMSCSELVKANSCHNEQLKKHRGEAFPGKILQLKKSKVAIPAGCSCPNNACVCPMSFEVGDSKSCTRPPKFLLIVGETGTGKSTFINGIANAFYRVRYGDNFRFKLIAEPEGQAKGAAANQAHSQTSVVAVYTLFPVDTGGADDSCRSAMDCPLTIIDTPGFGDTRGLAEDERIVKRIAKVLGEDGVSIPGMTGLLHAVGFVVKASQNRLTIPQKYIFDQALSLFGKDIEQIILPVLTFADSNEPQALAALKEDNVPHQRYLKFNNGMLYADNSDVDSIKTDSSLTLKQKKEKEMNLKANTLDWDRGELNYLDLFDVIGEMKNGVSLQNTKEVLKNRRNLEVSMEGLMKRVKQGASMLSTLQQELDFIDSLDAVIKDADARKTKTVKVPRIRKKDVPLGRFVTVCSSCTKTCHLPCAYANNSDKAHCAAMGTGGYCTVCPGRCYWNLHCNDKHYFEDYEEDEVITVKEIAEKYKVNINDRNAKKLMIQGLFEDFIKTHDELSYNLVTIHKCLQELEKLALRQYPLSVASYVDNLIKVQENEKKPGWEARVQHLRGAKESAEIIAKAREGQDPFGQVKEDVMKRCTAALQAEIKKKKGLWSKCKSYIGL